MGMLYPKQILQPVRDYLKKLEQELVRRKARIATEDPFRDSSRLNDNASDDTEAAEQFGHARAEAMAKETSEALARVRSAMERVTKGEYGKCVKCKKMVDTDRLSIDPTVALCVSGAEEAV